MTKRADRDMTKRAGAVQQIKGENYDMTCSLLSVML